jgi:hypothetical protein
VLGSDLFRSYTSARNFPVPSNLLQPQPRLALNTRQCLPEGQLEDWSGGQKDDWGTLFEAVTIHTARSMQLRHKLRARGELRLSKEMGSLWAGRRQLTYAPMVSLPVTLQGSSRGLSLHSSAARKDPKGSGCLSALSTWAVGMFPNSSLL